MRWIMLLVLSVGLLLTASCGEQNKAGPTPSQIPTATPTTLAPTLVPTPTESPTRIPPPKFEVGSMMIIPENPVAGEEVTIEAQVFNVGNGGGSYQAILKVDGQEIGRKEVTVAPGSKETASFVYVFDIPGSANLEIDGDQVTVTVLKPALLKVNSLSIAPTVIFPNQEATIDAEVTNVGEVEGSPLANLKVNGIETDNRPVALAPGGTTSISFKLIRDTPGTYEIRIGDKSANLTVPVVATYTNEDYLYSISYPSDWDIDDSDPENVIISWPRVLDIETKVSVAPTGTSLDAYYGRLLDSIKVDLPGFEVSTTTAITKGGEVIGYAFEGESLTDGVRFNVLGELSTGGRWAWFRFGRAPQAVYELHKPMIETVLSSFVPPVVATGYHENTTEGFSLTFPPGWDGMETGEQFPFLEVLSPFGEPQVFAGVQLYRSFENTSAKDEALSRSQGFSEAFTNFQIISQRPVTLGPQTQGYEAVFTFTNQSGVDLKEKDVTVIRGTQSFVIFALATLSTFRSQSAEVDRLISSFTLKDPRPFGVSRQDSLFLLGGEILTLDPPPREKQCSGPSRFYF